MLLKLPPPPAVICCALGLIAAPSRAADDGLAFFENRIRPVFAKHCYSCHSADAKRLKGDLRLDAKEHFMKGGSGGPVVVPGEPDKSPLITAVRYNDADLRMPPDNDGPKKLPDTAIADLVAWVKMGAPFPDSPQPVKKESAGRLWSLQPLANPQTPAVRDSQWAQSPVDAFILQKLEATGAKPSPRADALTLIRRMTFDLTGLPPTPEEVEAFERETISNQQSAIENLIERLLASPAYGERWGRHWLDVVRYADTAGETADYPVPLAWRYRNYVIDSFNADKPYDEFLREQIAGDVIARTGPRERYAERATATGYLAISRRFGFDSENYHNLTIQDTIDTLGQSVLGLSLGCARCHDHKFDPVTMRDYYALYGIFDSTRYAFPGSEQKQKFRAMTPLQPPSESLRAWREYDERVAALAQQLEARKQPVPGAILRSLHDPDGDFEMQAPAAGGSNGVLVPPWLYEGRIAVTASAQSPFRNVYPRGKVGASVSVGAAGYRIAQGLNPRRTRGVLHVNLDFRVSAPAPDAPGSHRFWIGGANDSPAVEVLISSKSIALRDGAKADVLGTLKPNQWHNLQLTLDLDARTISGSVGMPGEVAAFSAKPFSQGWKGSVDFAALDSRHEKDAALPALDLDNFAAQEIPLRAVTTASPVIAKKPGEPDEAALNAELQRLVGIDGGFDLQTDGKPPATPWGPGPNSVVKISAESQSPFRNLFPAGGLGVHMPNRAEYDGFGQALTSVKPDKDGRLFVAFDFRCASVAAGGDGSWRYYLGHGPGHSAAVELFFNGTQFFPRFGDARDPVCALRIGEWNQVQLALDTKAKTYTGTITSASGRTEFGGKFASGWDGTIDYTFIDSYGHRGGVRPALDADHFVLRDTPLAKPDATLSDAGGDANLRTAVADIRQKLAAAQGDTEKLKRQLDAMLTDGPDAMTYGMSEGTPHNARLQIRGEMDRPGDEVPRGFVAVLGDAALPPDVEGSGRLELARWLTRPENPLTARVMVNRIWQYHFGRGLVATPNDFGVRGQPPTHPALLDHLAAEFIKRGWSVKQMHRLIMRSATYQQSSGTGENYASFPRRRLSAEELRDAILAISGTIDRSPGGAHAFPSPLGWGYTQHGPFAATYEHDKRSIYLMVQRIKRHPFLALFDGADPNATTPERRATTVPTQALFFLNDPFVHGKAESCAARLIAAHPGENERIEGACKLATGRRPSDAERADAAEFLAAYRAGLSTAKKGDAEKLALAAYIRTLFGSNEFLHLD